MVIALLFIIYISSMQMYQSLQQTTFNVLKRLFLIEYGLVPMTKWFQNFNHAPVRRLATPVANMKSLYYPVQSYVHVLKVAECQIWMAKIFCNAGCYWDKEHNITSWWLLLFYVEGLYYSLKKHALIYIESTLIAM